ncbi:MAG TPA: hypothetical protein VKU19_27205 [Bryobacteraceae bacterium]|nr:hypothetical protein [Bryobacteraceae bacterium]
MGIEQIKLKDKHTWKCRPGYSICVIDRGVLRFDYPSKWIVKPEQGAVHLHDREPCVESCDLGVSTFQVPHEAVRGLDLDETLEHTLSQDKKPYHQSEIRHITRPDLEISWLEQHYKDPENNRDARFRVALARGTVLCLISMSYWSNRAPGLERVWDEVLRTLVMGIQVTDPTVGPTIH